MRALRYTIPPRKKTKNALSLTGDINPQVPSVEMTIAYNSAYIHMTSNFTFAWQAVIMCFDTNR